MLISTKNQLIINRLKLKEGGQKFHYKVTSQDLEITTLKIIEPVIVDIDVFKNSDTIVVSGAVDFRVKLNLSLIHI